MNTKPRKACTNCYQKKVRCNWTESSPICSYCLNHGLECLLPDPAQPPQRVAVKDKFAEIDARLRRLEEESRSSSNSAHGLEPGFQKNHQPPVQVSPLEDTSTYGTTGQNGFHSSVSMLRNISDGHSEVEVPSTTIGISPELEVLHAENSLQHWNQRELSSDSGLDIRRFRGDATPWNVLVYETSKSTLANSLFNSTVVNLAEEERSTRPATGNIQFDFVKEFPPMSNHLVLEYARHYASEAPFQLVYWAELNQKIEIGLFTKRWNHWGEIVTILLYVAFGSTHSGISLPDCDCDIYFKKAWEMLPKLLMEQDLWALKGITLMGGAIPETCYTLLGSASRMAISLGFHRAHYDNIYTPIQAEEGRRCWWLCYVLEKTLSLVLGRPSTNLDTFDAELPRPFSALDDSMSTFTVHDGNLTRTDDPNDEEAIAFYVDLIEVVRTRDQMLTGEPVLNSISLSQNHFGSKHEAVAEIILHWKATSHLKRPLDFDSSRPRSLRATICDLCYYNSIISLDRYLKRNFESDISNESKKAARASINIISGSSENGLTMCIWMWLYYAFSGAVVLFLDVVHNPLNPEAALNLALISDLEKLCTPLSHISPGAKRVMNVSREMNKVAFDIIKASAKRKAQEDDNGVGIGHARIKQRRTEGAQGQTQFTDMSTEAPNGQLSPNSIPAVVNEHPFNPFPANFSWDDWDQWLNTAAL